MSIKKLPGKYDRADAIYDSFKTKDMSRQQFRKAYLDATDSTKLQRDLGETLAFRQNLRTQKLLGKQKKLKIDSAISEN